MVHVTVLFMHIKQIEAHQRCGECGERVPKYNWVDPIKIQEQRKNRIGTPIQYPLCKGCAL